MVNLRTELACTKENSRKTRNQVKANGPKSINQFTKANGKITSQMAMERKQMKIKATMGSGTMAFSMVLVF